MFGEIQSPVKDNDTLLTGRCDCSKIVLSDKLLYLKHQGAKIVKGGTKTGG